MSTNKSRRTFLGVQATPERSTIVVLATCLIALLGTLLLLGPYGAMYREQPTAHGVFGLSADYALNVSTQIGQGWTFVILLLPACVLTMVLASALIAIWRVWMLCSRGARFAKSKASSAASMVRPNRHHESTPPETADDSAYVQPTY